MQLFATSICFMQRWNNKLFRNQCAGKHVCTQIMTSISSNIDDVWWHYVTHTNTSPSQWPPESWLMDLCHGEKMGDNTNLLYERTAATRAWYIVTCHIIIYPGDVSKFSKHFSWGSNVWAHNWGRKMHQPLLQHQRPGSRRVITEEVITTDKRQPSLQWL